MEHVYISGLGAIFKDGFYPLPLIYYLCYSYLILIPHTDLGNSVFDIFENHRPKSPMVYQVWVLEFGRLVSIIDK